MKRIEGVPAEMVLHALQLEKKGGDPDLMVWDDPGDWFRCNRKLRATWSDYGFVDFADYKLRGLHLSGGER